jgi:multiple sugar transport system permease protein
MIFWGEFIYAVTFLDNGGLFPVSVILLDQVGSTSTSWNSLLAIAVITSMPMLIVFAFTQRQFRAGMAAGALK